MGKRMYGKRGVFVQTRDNTYLSDGLETLRYYAREIVTIPVTAGSDRIHCVYGAMWSSSAKTL